MVDCKHNNFDFPKVELHCHLDGCFRISTVIELARHRQIKLPTYDPKELADNYCITSRKKNLHEFLLMFRTFTPIFAGSGEAIARMTREAVEDKAKQGIRYIEFRYSPHLLADRDVKSIAHCSETGHISPREVVEVVCEAGRQAQKDFNIEVRFILCCILAHPDWSMEIAQFCKEFSDRGVVAIDIAGTGHEGGIPIDLHQKAFQFCKDNAIHITAHAGEAGPAEEVRKAINTLFATRIGHGYHVLDDEDVYTEAREKDIHFEVCPLSSYLTASVNPDMTVHPAKRFMVDKVNFSLSSDDPGMMNTTLLKDYSVARTDFGFTDDEIKVLNLNALRSAFCDDEVKQRLLKEFEETATI
ncbi:unnamed protein product [Clavelina lepadiformis]|uniref:Adenosine deaminase n=1 Tax=Clavelina lepadiformis TaxID=159417 RepID=A0ABP0H023_CLALP